MTYFYIACNGDKRGPFSNNSEGLREAYNEITLMEDNGQISHNHAHQGVEKLCKKGLDTKAINEFCKITNIEVPRIDLNTGSSGVEVKKMYQSARRFFEEGELTRREFLALTKEIEKKSGRKYAEVL